MPMSRGRPVSNFVFFLVAVLAVVASVTIFFLARADERAKDRALQRYKLFAQAEIAKAQAKAAQAGAQAEAAHAESVRLALELEKTRKAMAEMRQPRELSDAQKQALLAVFKKWQDIAQTVRPGVHIDLAFASVSDPDSQQYAMQFVKVFHDAGMPVMLKVLGTAIETDPSDADLELAIPRGKEERFQPLVDAMLEQFKQVGLAIKTDVNPDPYANRLTLIVLSKRR